MQKHAFCALHFIALLILLCILAPHNGALAADKWQTLLRSSAPDQAEGSTKKTAQTGQPPAQSYPQQVADLLADFLQARLDADIMAQARAAEGLFQAGKSHPEGELFLDLLSYYQLPACSRLKLVNGYQSEGCAPNVKRILANLKLNVLDKSLLTDELYAQYRNESGRVWTTARLSGPFNYIDYSQEWKLTPAELEPAAKSYPASMGCEVNVVDITPDKEGRFPTKDLLPQDAMYGQATIQFTLKSDKARQCLLRFDRATPNRAWLNGELIFSSRNMITPETPNSGQYYLKVQLKEGNNCLLAATNDGAIFSVVLLKEDGSPLSGVASVPFDHDSWAKCPPRRIAGYSFSQPVISLYMDSLQKLCKSMPKPAGDILLADGYQKCDFTLKAHEIWKKLCKTYPDSPAIKALYADFLQESRYSTNDSSDRLMSQAASLLRELRRDAPQLLLPQLQLARYYKDVRQPRQQQKLLLELAEEFPKSAEVQHRLSQYYMKKRWYYLSMQAMDKCVELNPQALQWKVNLLISQKNYVGALLLAEQAYKEHKYCCLDCLKKMRKRYAKFLPENAEKSAEPAKDEVALKTENGKDTAADAEDEDEDEDDTKISLLEDDYQSAMDEMDLKKAAGFLKELAELNPSDPARWEALGRLEIRTEDSKSAIRHLTKAFVLGCRQSKPKPVLLRMIRQIGNKELPDVEYLHKLTPEMTEKVQKGTDAHASHATVIRSRIVELFPGIGGILTDRNAIKVFDRNGINYLSELDVNGDILFCKTISPDGQEFIPDSTENFSLKNAMSMYKVQPGSVIDYASRSYFPTNGHGDNDFSDSFYFQDINADVELAEYVLILPKQMLKYAEIKTFPEDFEPEVKEISKVRVALVWKASGQKGIKPEQGMPQGDKILKNLQVYFYPRENVYSDMTSSDNALHTNREIAEQAAQICKDAKTVQEKVRAIYNWITLNINEQGNNYTPRDTFALKSGSPDNMLELCRAMLSAQGVRSTIAQPNASLNEAGLLNTEERVQAAGDFGWPVLLRVYTGVSGPDIWLTFSSGQRFKQLKDIPQGVPGALALEEQENGLTLCHVMQDQLGISPLYMPEIIELSEDGSAQVNLAITSYGNDAASLRQMMENPREKQRNLEGIAADSFPGITNLKIDISGDEKLGSLQQKEGKLRISLSGKVIGFAQPIGGKMVVQRNMKFNSPYYATQLPRTYPLQIGQDLVEADQQHYIAPEGWGFVAPPGDCWLQTQFGLFCVDYTVNGRGFTRNVFTVIPAQTIKPEDCADFNRFLDEIKKRLEASFTLEKISPEAIKTPFKDPLPEEAFPGSYLQKKRLPANLRKYID